MRQAWTHIGFPLAILFAWCCNAFALDPSLDISQYAHTAWKIRDGFARGSITSMAQTPDGYLWLGTEFGLLRFDGVRAVPWQPPGNQHLPSVRIFSLLVSRNGTIWIGTDGGLASWNEGKLTAYPELNGEIIFALLEDREGTIWAGAGGTPLSGKLCAIQRSSAQCSGGNGQLGPGVVALYQDSSGTLWAGVKDGLWRWKPGPRKFYPLAGELDGIQAIAEDGAGALLIGWQGGIYRFEEGKTAPYPVAGILPRFRAHRMLRDGNGGLWIGTTGSGLLHVHEGRTDVISRTDDLSMAHIYGLFEDHEGDIWIASKDGLDRFGDFTVPTLTVAQGLSENVVSAVLADNDGSLWFTTYGGLNRWDQGKVTVPQIAGVSRDGTINGSIPNTIFQDNRGRVWISTPSNLGYNREWPVQPHQRYSCWKCSFNGARQ